MAAAFVSLFMLKTRHFFMQALIIRAYVKMLYHVRNRLKHNAPSGSKVLRQLSDEYGGKEQHASKYFSAV